MDKKKVIEALKNADVDVYGVLKMTTQVRDILVELLTEQEAVVRCKDCKYAAPDMACSHESEWGNEISRNRDNPNWFCADGELKD